jgi:hypothetical protein
MFKDDIIMCLSEQSCLWIKSACHTAMCKRQFLFCTRAPGQTIHEWSTAGWRFITYLIYTFISSKMEDWPRNTPCVHKCLHAYVFCAGVIMLCVCTCMYNANCCLAMAMDLFTYTGQIAVAMHLYFALDFLAGLSTGATFV